MPCCLQVNQGLSKAKCIYAKKGLMGGTMGWSSECPRSAEEAQELLKASTKPPAPAVPTGGSEKRPEENQSRKGEEDEDEDHQPLCHKLPEGVREMKDLQGPFKAGSHLEVGCALGWQPLNQSEETWHVKCVGWDAWTAVGHYGGCTVVTCSACSDVWGTWWGSRDFNRSLQLRCADGFNVEGASELHCLASGLWDRLPGRCLPNGGNPELWRSKLRYSALMSFLGLAVTVALVLWVCRPPHEPGLELPLSRAPAALSRHRATAPATE